MHVERCNDVIAKNFDVLLSAGYDPSQLALGQEAKRSKDPRLKDSAIAPPEIAEPEITAPDEDAREAAVSNLKTPGVLTKILDYLEKHSPTRNSLTKGIAKVSPRRVNAGLEYLGLEVVDRVKVTKSPKSSLQDTISLSESERAADPDEFLTRFKAVQFLRQRPAHIHDMLLRRQFDASPYSSIKRGIDYLIDDDIVHTTEIDDQYTVYALGRYDPDQEFARAPFNEADVTKNTVNIHNSVIENPKVGGQLIQEFSTNGIAISHALRKLGPKGILTSRQALKRRQVLIAPTTQYPETMSPEELEGWMLGQAASRGNVTYEQLSEEYFIDKPKLRVHGNVLAALGLVELEYVDSPDEQKAGKAPEVSIRLPHLDESEDTGALLSTSEIFDNLPRSQERHELTNRTKRQEKIQRVVLQSAVMVPEKVSDLIFERHRELGTF